MGEVEPLNRWQEHKKQFWAKARHIPSPLDPRESSRQGLKGAPFFSSVAPTQKRGGLFFGVTIQRGEGPSGMVTSKVKPYHQMRQLLHHVTCFILLLASSRLKRSRGQEMKTLPLKSYKYVHES